MALAEDNPCSFEVCEDHVQLVRRAFGTLRMPIVPHDCRLKRGNRQLPANIPPGYFTISLMAWTVCVLFTGCTLPSDSIVTEPSALSTPTSVPPATPIPEVTAMELYVECEGTDSPDRKLRSALFGTYPECYLEGERLRIAGHLHEVNTEDEEGDVKLTVEYWLNSKSLVAFGGIILRDIPKSDRLHIQNFEVAVADCTVAHSAPIGFMGTGRVLTDCELLDVPD